MWVASSFDDVGRGPQIAAFVYERGGPYGCATSQRSTPVVHTDAATCFIARFARKSATCVLGQVETA